MQRLLLLLVLWGIPMEIIAEDKTLADLFYAIHMRESRGQVGKIKGHNDAGKALGPMQIHRKYWIDSEVPGKYEDCADLAYSKRVMLAYWNKWAKPFVEMGDYQILARIHNGGPKGYLRNDTKVYWNGTVIRKKDGSEIVKDKGIRHYLADYRNR